MTKKTVTTVWFALAFVASAFYGTAVNADHEPGHISVYDESAYTQYVETTMKKLDKLYLQFCGSCNVDGSKALKARNEYYATVRDLLQHMNARFDSLDPKKGAALSSTEVLVNIHVLTMLVDILTATQMEVMADHPYSD